jgi:hypothetical protein
MPLLTIIAVIVLVGMLLWVLNRFVPMQEGVRTLLNGVVVVLLMVWLLDVFGLIQPLLDIRVG